MSTQGDLYPLGATGVCRPSRLVLHPCHAVAWHLKSVKRGGCRLASMRCGGGLRGSEADDEPMSSSGNTWGIRGRAAARRCNSSPNSVTLNITYGSPHRASFCTLPITYAMVESHTRTEAKFQGGRRWVLSSC